MKKSLTISLIVLVLVFFALLYYFFFMSKNTSTLAPVVTNTPSNNFFPFGGNSSNNASSTTTNSQTNNTLTNNPADYLSKLRLISNEPVAGAAFVDGRGTTTATIRYMEKATGHIYDVPILNNTVSEVSDSTFPKIHEAFFTNTGSKVIGRYVADDEETIETFVGSIGSTTIASLLPAHINFLSVSPSTKTIFYIQKSSTGSTGIAAAGDGSNKKQVWSSTLENLLPQDINDTSALVTTAPNAGVPGESWLINTKTGSAKIILSGNDDLSVLANPTVSTLLAWTSDGGGSLFTYTLANGATTRLSPATFPEKCVFDPNNKNNLYCAVPQSILSTNSLDNWYLGTVSYSDDIWKYDLSNNTSTMIENLALNANRQIDAFNLELNSAGTILLFQNKIDGSLWSLNLQ